jgi:type IV secretory pathway VirB10-like protein
VQFNFAFLSRFGGKFVEVAGAGLASAVCAYGLGQLREPPPPPPPPIVQVVPASDDAMRMARNDHALLTEFIRKEAEGQKKPADASATANPTTAPAAQPSQTATAAPTRRTKTERVAVAPRTTEPLSIQPPATAAPMPKPVARSAEILAAHDGFTVSASGGAEERPLLGRVRQIAAWFLPDNDRIFGVVPRPPSPVGQFLQSAM